MKSLKGYTLEQGKTCSENLLKLTKLGAEMECYNINYNSLEGTQYEGQEKL